MLYKASCSHRAFSSNWVPGRRIYVTKNIFSTKKYHANLFVGQKGWWRRFCLRLSTTLTCNCEACSSKSVHFKPAGVKLLMFSVGLKINLAVHCLVAIFLSCCTHACNKDFINSKVRIFPVQRFSLNIKFILINLVLLYRVCSAFWQKHCTMNVSTMCLSEHSTPVHLFKKKNYRSYLWTFAYNNYKSKQ